MSGKIRWSRFSRAVALGLSAVVLSVWGWAADRPETVPLGLDWAVRLAPGTDADAVAASLGAINRGSIGILSDTYRFAIPLEQESRPDRRVAVKQALAQRSEVLWEEEQIPRVRVPKALRDEPLFAKEWYLENTAQAGGIAGVDTGAAQVWELGFTGKGVGVVVNDTGTEFSHPDLSERYVMGLDTWGNDSNPSPQTSDENHGTAVSGIILASGNGTGSVGVAPQAKLYPVRLLRDGEGIPDADEAEALSFQSETIGISNNSWGPSDENGISLASMGSLVNATLAEATRAGRGGKGTIFVWAAGNGGNLSDRASYDGYNNSRYTITVGAIGQNGRTTGYSEPGCNVVVCAPSQSVGTGITTTDRSGAAGYSTGSYTDDFSGTSAATPMVSGVVALMLEANPQLTWRDVQHILARTAVRTDPQDPGWQENGAGFAVSDYYGFGRVDAIGAVRLAQIWPGTSSEVSRVTPGSTEYTVIPDRGSISRTLQMEPGLQLEHVEVTVDLSHTAWRQLEIAVVSPSGTRSILSAPFEDQASGYATWAFETAQMRGEDSGGTWRLEIRDTESGTTGVFRRWSLRTFGTTDAPKERPRLKHAVWTTSVSHLALSPESILADAEGKDWRILSAFALDRGTVVEEGDGNWSFDAPRDAFGSFPIGLTVASPTTGEARHLMLTIERPIAHVGATRGTATVPFSAVPTVLQAPSGGAISSSGTALTYTRSGAGGGKRLDRAHLSLDPSGENFWMPIIEGEELAMRLDGRNDFVALKNLELANGFTLDTWVKPLWWGEANGGGVGFGRLLDCDIVSIFTNGIGHAFYPDGAYVIYLSYGNGESEAFVTDPGTVRLGDWQRVSVSVDSSRSPPVRFYLDGVERNLTVPADVTPQARGNLASTRNATVRIGESEAGTRAFEGLMARYRIWSGALNASQLAERGAHLSSAQRDAALVVLEFEDADQVAGPTIYGSGGATYAGGEYALDLLSTPWSGFEAYFSGTVDSGSGWWLHPVLGWLYGDRFPWVLSPGLDWVFAGGGGGGSYWLYRSTHDLGWLFTRDEVYPWFYAPGLGSWIRQYPGTPWFYVDKLGRYELFD